jgi:hypothetical protein
LEFRSKIGAVIVIPITLVVVLGGASVARAIADGRPVIALVLAVPILLVFWVAATTRYKLSGEHLEIRCAFMRSTLPLRTIRRLRPTRNPQSAPALSLDRLEITHDAGIALISPANRDTFISELRARCPQMEVEG